MSLSYEILKGQVECRKEGVLVCGRYKYITVNL